MTAQPRTHRDREPGPAASPRRTSVPPPPEDAIAAGTASRAGRDWPGGRLAYCLDEAARLTGLTRDLLYDRRRSGKLADVKVGMRRLITRQHLRQFLGIAS